MGVYFFSIAILKSQTYYFAHYQVEHGLSNNAVLCSMQDSKGFMWFGTKDGLNRFDGYTFKVFQNIPGSSSTLGSNYVRVLHEHHDGSIWVGTDQGIYIYDPLLERFSMFSPQVTDEILDIQEDKSGNVWFINDLVLYKFDVEKDSIIPITQNINASSFCIADDDHDIWTGTSSGNIIRYHQPTKESTVYSVFPHSLETIDLRIEKIHYTQKGELIIGTKKYGIKVFNTHNYTYRDILQKDAKNEAIFVRDILQNTENEYWFATESGIIVFNDQTNNSHFITREQDNPWSIADNAVYTLCKDLEGAIWAGTYFGGVNYYSQINTFFQKFFPTSDPNAISGYAVREIVEDKYGYLWIGTEDGGLNKFNPTNNAFINYKPMDNTEGVAHKNIHGLLASGDTIWIGTFEHGLDLMDAKSAKVFKHYNAEDKADALQNNFIFSILKTRAGKIFLTTARGLYTYNPHSASFARYPKVPGHIFYTSLFEDDEGTLWVGTWRDGLLYFDASMDSDEKGVPRVLNPTSPSSNRINRIFQDSQKKIWVATEGGLFTFDKTTASFLPFDKQHELPSSLILSLLEDDEDRLWISTSKGLARFDRKNGEVKVFTQANGLPSDQFNYNSSYKDSVGNLYFGTVNGLIRFNPKNYIEEQYQAPVYITGFQVHNEELQIGESHSSLDSSIIYAETIVLKHHQSTFSIDFAALSYTSPTMTEYAYKMEGLDKEWTRIKTNRKTYFTNIRPGKYIFRVNVIDAQGQFKGKETKLHIEITPPWWASPSAYLLYALLFILIAYYIISSYDRKIKERNRRRLDNIKHEREKNLHQAKIDFFTQIVHEIRTPLTLIKAPLEKVMLHVATYPKAKKHLELIERNTERLIALSGQLLDFRKVEAQGFGLKFTRINVTKIVSDVCANFQLSAKKNKIRFILEKPDTDVYADLDQEALVKIMTNLVDNAIKYGKSQVAVILHHTTVLPPRRIQIKIVNDGSYIPSKLQHKIFEPFYRIKEENHKQGTGIGLPLSRSLTELMGGSLELLSAEDDKNTFIVTLPIKQSDHIPTNIEQSL